MDLVEVRPTAWMDRWTVLDLGDQLALFGFAPELRRRSGLSWVRSAALVRLDLRLGRAMTEDGIVYGLGRRFRLSRFLGLAQRTMLRFAIGVEARVDGMAGKSPVTAGA